MEEVEEGRRGSRQGSRVISRRFFFVIHGTIVFGHELLCPPVDHGPKHILFTFDCDCHLCTRGTGFPASPYSSRVFHPRLSHSVLPAPTVQLVHARRPVSSMESLKRMLKRRSWPSASKPLGKSHIHSDSCSRASEGFVRQGLGLGTFYSLLVHRQCASCCPCPTLRCVRARRAGKLEYEAEQPQQGIRPFGYEVCNVDANAQRISPDPTTAAADTVHQKADHQSFVGWRLGASDGTTQAAKSAGVGALILDCQQEENPYNVSRDITPAASTRSSHNWKKTPNSPPEALMEVGDDGTYTLGERSGPERFRCPLPVPISCSPDPVPVDPSGGVFGATPRGGKQVITRHEHAFSETLSKGPAQTREIPRLDQTPLWTHSRSTSVSSASSCSYVTDSAGRQHPMVRSGSLTKGTTTIPSWDIPEAPNWAIGSTRESQNPGF